MNENIEDELLSYEAIPSKPLRSFKMKARVKYIRHQSSEAAMNEQPLSEQQKDTVKELLDAIAPMMDAFKINTLPVKQFLPDWDEDLFIEGVNIPSAKENTMGTMIGGISNREMIRIVTLHEKLNRLFEQEAYEPD